MTLLDHERVLLRLKRELLAKPSWGQRELLGLLARLEAECAFDELPSDRLWRLYAVELEELFFDRIREGREATNASPVRSGVVPAEPTHAMPEEARWKQQPPPTPSPSPPSPPSRASRALART